MEVVHATNYFCLNKEDTTCTCMMYVSDIKGSHLLSLAASQDIHEGKVPCDREQICSRHGSQCSKWITIRNAWTNGFNYYKIE